MHWISSNLKHLTVKSTCSTLYTPNTYHPSPKFSSVSLYNQPFSRYKIVENRKCTEWPQNELETWAVKSTLYALNTYPWGPNFTPFHSTVAPFWVNRSFWFSYMLRWWTWTFQTKQKIIKNWKLKISKLPNRFFFENHWEENSGEVWK